MVNRHPVKYLISAVCVCIFFNGKPAYGQQAFKSQDPNLTQNQNQNEDLLAKANAFYNEGKYENAIKTYILAIHQSPAKADAYRNMARAYFWKHDYSAAAAYYDMYLSYFPQVSDIPQIQKERRLAESRTEGVRWKIPKSQRYILDVLERELAQGVAMTQNGGGAYKTYQTLLRSNYAHPDLIRLRARLFTKLLFEFDNILRPKKAQPAPILNTQAWQLQNQRLDAAKSFVITPQQRMELDARRAVTKAASALLSGRYQQAVTLLERARKQNPGHFFLSWFYISALIHSNRFNDALEALNVIEPDLKRQNPALDDSAHIVRAVIYQKLNRAKDAGKIYRQILLR